MNLGELWDIARGYGKVLLRTCQNGKYFAQIVFDTSRNTSMIVMSDHNQNTPEDALKMAISEARRICNFCTIHRNG